MQGRFTSPDEFKGGPDELFDFEEDASDNPTFYADLENPQSLNKYQYGYNNPYRYTDEDGHCPICLGAVVAAAVFILSNPSTIGPTRPQTTSEKIADLAGIVPIPGSKVIGKAIVGAIFKGGGKTVVNQGVKQTVKQNISKAKQVIINKKNGDAFRDKVAAGAKKGHSNVQKEITVKTKSGVKTRVDVIGTRNGKPKLIEAKGSRDAPLTKAQKKAFPEIEKSGATVVGKGKPGYEGGTKIPPQKVKIVRPLEQ
jgi:hypothetical protein